MKLILLFAATTLFSNNPMVVENGRNPSTDMKIIFKQNLRIGPDSDSDHLLWAGSLVTCEVNSKGHIFIVDSGNNRILEFDPNGSFLRQVGRSGKGPGEFERLYTFQIMADDTAIAFDNTLSTFSFSFFDKEMNFIRRTPNLANDLFIQSVSLSRDGRWTGSFFMTFSNGKANSGILSMEPKPKITLTTDDYINVDQAKVANPSYWVNFFADWFKVPARGSGVYGFSLDGTVYTAINNSYEITRSDANLKANLIVRRDYKPIVRSPEHLRAIVFPVYDEMISLLPDQLRRIITPATIEAAIEKAELPLVKPPIYAIFPMNRNNMIIVVHDFDAVSGNVSGDIFDGHGQYIGRTHLPKIAVNVFAGMFGGPTKLLFHGDHAYAMIEENEELNMVRYRIQINKGS